MDVALIVSGLSLLVSLTTLYVAQLRRPRIQCKIGPDIRVYHGHFDEGLSTGIYLPVTFINTAPTTGAVVRAAITITPYYAPQQEFLLRWDQFVKMEPRTYDYYAEEPAHPLAIEGRSSLTKIAWFFWFAQSRPSLLFNEGRHELRFYYWQRADRRPQVIESSFVVPSETASELEVNRSYKSSAYVQILLDQELDVNRVLSPTDARKLLRR